MPFIAKDIIIPDSLISEAISKFIGTVEKRPDGCWWWLGSKRTKYGHGRFNFKGFSVSAHRFSYKFIGSNKLEPDLVIDHQCNNPRCVNPQHLKQVTVRENNLRGNGRAAKKARQTHCINGHPLLGENLQISPKGYRRCRECRRQSCRKRWKDKSYTMFDKNCLYCKKTFSTPLWLHKMGRSIFCSVMCRNQVNGKNKAKIEELKK